MSCGCVVSVLSTGGCADLLQVIELCTSVSSIFAGANTRFLDQTLYS